MQRLIDYINNKTGKTLDEAGVRMLNPLVLAYIGDTIYDLFVRTFLIHRYDTSVHQLHIKSISYVQASSQAAILDSISSLLTEEENYIVKRGRNARSGTIPKNADIAEYHRATGFEALLGYLFLTGQEDRLYQIMDFIFEAKDEMEERK